MQEVGSSRLRCYAQKAASGLQISVVPAGHPENFAQRPLSATGAEDAPDARVLRMLCAELTSASASVHQPLSPPGPTQSAAAYPARAYW